jgi:DNA-damage-inducible protein D
MGYTEWRNFSKVIGKAKDARRNSGIRIESHFQDTAREVALDSGAVRSIDDVKLTRYACYPIAQNGDPHKGKSPSCRAISLCRRETRNSSVNVWAS